MQQPKQGLVCVGQFGGSLCHRVGECAKPCSIGYRLSALGERM
jgi:hypothetical protein